MSIPFFDISSLAREKKESFGGILSQMRSVHFEAQYFYEVVIRAILTKDKSSQRSACSRIQGHV